MQSLRTPRLELRPATATTLRAELEGNGSLARALGVDVPPGWPPELYDADAVRHILTLLGEREDGGAFGLYYIIVRPDQHAPAPRGVLIGVGGFKGDPDADGEVEIGYGVLPDFQRRGFATEAVRAWVSLAFADPRVERVVGQTLDSLTPSIGVLEKAGFVYAGSGEDPGAPAGERVVRYECSRAAHAARAVRTGDGAPGDLSAT